MEHLLVDRLMRPYDIVELPGGKKVRVRALTDAEKVERDLHALTKSAELKKNYDTKGEALTALWRRIEESDPDALQDGLIAFYYVPAMRQAIKKFSPEYIPFPDEATDEERREVILKRQQQEEDLEKKRREHTTALMEKEEKRVRKLGGEDLEQAFARASINEDATNEYFRHHNAMTLFLAVEEEDGSQRFLKDAREALHLHDAVSRMLLEKQGGVDGIDPFELASQSQTDSSKDSSPSSDLEA